MSCFYLLPTGFYSYSTPTNSIISLPSPSWETPQPDQLLLPSSPHTPTFCQNNPRYFWLYNKLWNVFTKNISPKYSFQIFERGQIFLPGDCVYLSVISVIPLAICEHNRLSGVLVSSVLTPTPTDPEEVLARSHISSSATKRTNDPTAEIITEET